MSIVSSAFFIITIALIIYSLIVRIEKRIIASKSCDFFNVLSNLSKKYDN